MKHHRILPTIYFVVAVVQTAEYNPTLAALLNLAWMYYHTLLTAGERQRICQFVLGTIKSIVRLI